MNVSRDVIDDLLGLYYSGEASPGTCALVEEFFRQNPAFEQESRRAAEALQSIGILEWPAPPDAQLERKALRRAKKLLQTQRILFSIACAFTLNALSLGFSFEIANGRIHARWLAIPGQREVVVVLAFLAVVAWFFYVSVRHKVRVRVLG